MLLQVMSVLACKSLLDLGIITFWHVKVGMNVGGACSEAHEASILPTKQSEVALEPARLTTDARCFVIDNQ